jgi:hypothetical protein
MKKRHKINPKKSKRLFTRTADGTHRFNLQGPKFVMRGGIRM